MTDTASLAPPEVSPTANAVLVLADGTVFQGR
ncbi:uncharacterized protein METZ01_LOCUS345318, partial [marine metagenome]